VTTGWQSLSIDRRQRINVCATEAANRPDRSHLKRIRIIGSQQNGFEYPDEALDFVAQGKVKTIVEIYPLADAPKAYDPVAQGEARFRAVLAMQSSMPVSRGITGNLKGTRGPRLMHPSKVLMLLRKAAALCMLVRYFRLGGVAF
jgi:hypothetical protein